MSESGRDSRPKLLFVSTRFLFPIDSGGKIRTTEVLRGLKGGRFRIVLACPATNDQLSTFKIELAELCDEVVNWPPMSGWRWQLARLAGVISSIPIPVLTDKSARGCEMVVREMARAAVTVFDFVHAAVLAPKTRSSPTVLFTHNFEAEIFKRHASVAGNVFTKLLWTSQYRKMLDFERRATRSFDTVIAVSERDAKMFRDQCGVQHLATIPTGVNQNYFQFSTPAGSNKVVFTGSMDWLANQDGIEFFLDDIWASVAAKVPNAEMVVIGRAPPTALVEKAKRLGVRWRFTGWVDDVRPHVAGADVFVIPLRVGGGTRIKAFEAMAMGVPVVSTAIGMEGLAVRPGEHYTLADRADDFASAVVTLLQGKEFGSSMAYRARQYVTDQFSNAVVAKRFEDICLGAIEASKTHGAVR